MEKKLNNPCTAMFAIPKKTKVITTDINIAKEKLIKNGVIAIPTETVYGLAGNALNEEAVKKIFDLKERPLHNPLIVHIKSTDELSKVALDIPPLAKKLATHFWPGSLTLVLKKHSKIPNIVTSGHDTVAVRVPNHPLTLALLNQLDFPLAAPSANPFGCVSPTTSKHVQDYFNNDIEVILDGGSCEKGIESTIIGFENDQPVLYRFGALSIEELEKVVGPIRLNTLENKNPKAPGMLSKHYAPKTPIYLTNNVQELIKSFKGKRIGLLVFRTKIIKPEIVHQELLAANGNLHEAAAKLYQSIHFLDRLELDVIIAEKFPNESLGITINDRLERASKSK